MCPSPGIGNLSLLPNFLSTIAASMIVEEQYHLLARKVWLWYALNDWHGRSGSVGELAFASCTIVTGSVGLCCDCRLIGDIIPLTGMFNPMENYYLHGFSLTWNLNTVVSQIGKLVEENKKVEGTVSSFSSPERNHGLNYCKKSPFWV